MFSIDCSVLEAQRMWCEQNAVNEFLGVPFELFYRLTSQQIRTEEGVYYDIVFMFDRDRLIDIRED